MPNRQNQPTAIESARRQTESRVAKQQRNLRIEITGDEIIQEAGIEILQLKAQIKKLGTMVNDAYDLLEEHGIALPGSARLTADQPMPLPSEPELNGAAGPG